MNFYMLYMAITTFGFDNIKVFPLHRINIL